MASKPKLLASVERMLFPHSPIEVQREVTHGVAEYHIYIEGEWHSRLPDENEAALQVPWLVKTYGDDWNYPSTRVNPDWQGWGKISKGDLLQWREDYDGEAEEEAVQAEGSR